jgi:hypothetical protein
MRSAATQEMELAGRSSSKRKRGHDGDSDEDEDTPGSSDGEGEPGSVGRKFKGGTCVCLQLQWAWLLCVDIARWLGRQCWLLPRG